jgi:hypothetical protein
LRESAFAGRHGFLRCICPLMTQSGRVRHLQRQHTEVLAHRIAHFECHTDRQPRARAAACSSVMRWTSGSAWR